MRELRIEGDLWVKSVEWVVKFYLLILVFSFGTVTGIAQDSFKFKKFISTESHFNHIVDSTLLVGDTVSLIVGKPKKGTSNNNRVSFNDSNVYCNPQIRVWCETVGDRQSLYAQKKVLPAGTWEINSDRLIIITDKMNVVLRHLESNRKRIVFVREE